MLALLTRQRDMLNIEGFFNTFRKCVVAFYHLGPFAFMSTIRANVARFKSSAAIFGELDTPEGPKPMWSGKS